MNDRIIRSEASGSSQKPMWPECSSHATSACRVCGCQPLGRLDGNESVHAAEDEQLGYLQRVQHVVHVAAFDHASQQGDDAVVVGRGRQFFELSDPVPQTPAVLLGEAFRSELRSEKLLLSARISSISRSRSAFFCSVSAFGVEWNRISP